VAARRPALRRAVASVPAPADLAWGLHFSPDLDRAAVHQPRGHQSPDEQIYRLEVVRDFADWVWDCSRIRCRSAGPHTHGPVFAVCFARGNRSARAYEREERRTRRAMSSSYSRVLRFIVVPIAVALCACTDAPGRPGKNPEVARPDEVLDFNILYKQNCSGCHGPQGNGGAAIALHNPGYLAVADDNVIRHTASIGVPGTPMTPFAQSAGGMLTDKQVDVIV